MHGPGDSVATDMVCSKEARLVVDGKTPCYGVQISKPTNVQEFVETSRDCDTTD